jgi:hypothetical protein
LRAGIAGAQLGFLAGPAARGALDAFADAGEQGLDGDVEGDGGIEGGAVPGEPFGEEGGLGE